MESGGNLWSSIEILKKTLWNFEFRQNRNSDKIGTQTKSEFRQNRDTDKITKTMGKKNH